MAEFTGQVVKLDRGFPLVRLEDERLLRCEHATDLEKHGSQRAVIGDSVEVLVPEGHEKAVITRINPRRCELMRKDPTERAVAQVLAANFDMVIVAQPLSEVNVRRLERELVLAHQTGAQVVVVLTKADLAEDERMVEDVRRDVKARVGRDVELVVVSQGDEAGVQRLREMLAPEGEPAKMAVLIGRSGVGKSSLINLLVGSEVQETQAVREGDGKGRHTTVNREIVALESGGYVVDMPGVRGLGMWEADEGIGTAFADVEELAEQCRFRDCKHQDEPGCAVLAAVAEGQLAPERLESYRLLKQETQAVRKRHEEARHMRGQKVSDEKKAAKNGGAGKGKGKGKGAAAGGKLAPRGLKNSEKARIAARGQSKRPR